MADHYVHRLQISMPLAVAEQTVLELVFDFLKMAPHDFLRQPNRPVM